MNFELLPIAFRMFPKREKKKEKNQKKKFWNKKFLFDEWRGVQTNHFLVHG